MLIFWQIFLWLDWNWRRLEVETEGFLLLSNNVFASFFPKIIYTLFHLHAASMSIHYILNLICIQRSMGLPSMHGSQNMNHIRLINKLFYVQARFKFLLGLSRSLLVRASKNKLLTAWKLKNKHLAPSPTEAMRARSKFRSRRSSLPSHTRSDRKAFLINSNLPFIHLNSSLVLVNSSPFALTDPRFGILHHHSPSLSYFWLRVGWVRQFV